MIDLGTVQLDEQSLFKQLRHDLKDDWFPDALDYDDLFEDSLLSNHISDIFTENSGRFTASKRSIFNIPKSNFTIRYALETGLADRAIYHGLVSFLVPRLDPLIPWNVFNHRHDAADGRSRYMFRRAIPAWRDFAGVVENATTGQSVLLSTDLSNYYENIDLATLRQTLESVVPNSNCSAQEKSQLRNHINILFDCLATWTFDGRRGLPQNRDASSFLANIYMLPIDRHMLSRGYMYYRYMDDIKIVCENLHDARRALKELIVQLRDRGLSINSKKTTFCAGSDRAQLSQILDAGSLAMQQIDQIWQSRAIGPILRSIPTLKNLTLSSLSANVTDSREFRYYIKRLEFLARCREFNVPDTFFNSVTSAIVAAAPDNPATTDQFVKYLVAAGKPNSDYSPIIDFLTDADRSFYTWQNFRLWLALAQLGVTTPSLRQRANALLQGADNATRAGAMLHLGATGTDADREQIAAHFSSLESFLGQRSALIAIHSLPYRPIVRDQVQPYVRADLRGVYRALHRASRGYFKPVQPMALTDAVDVERDYD